MKNLKNIVAALTLTATLGFSSTIANAGILMSDKATPSTTCSTKRVRATFLEGIIIIGKAGMLVSDGILVTDGMLMSDGLFVSDAPCTDGILMSDGMLASDGMLMSD